jgi:hypothetical protein
LFSINGQSVYDGTNLYADASGRLHAAMTTYNGAHGFFAGEAVDEDWTIMQVSTRHAQYRYDNQHRQMAMATDGSPRLLFWEYNRLVYGTPRSGGWDLTPVPATATPSQYATLAVDKSDRPHLLYAQYTPTRIVYATLNGSDWSTQVVDSTASGVIEFELAVTSTGAPVAATRLGAGPILVRIKNGAAWSTLRSVVGNSAHIVCDAEDRLHLVLRTGLLGSDLRYLRFTLGGATEVDKYFPSAAGDPQIALDSNQQAHIVMPDRVIHTVDDSTEILPFTQEGLNAVFIGDTPFFIGHSTGFPNLYTLRAHLEAVEVAPNVTGRPAAGLTWSWPSLNASLLRRGHRLRRLSDGTDLSGLIPPERSSWTVTGLPPNSPQQVRLTTIYPGLAAPAPASAVVYTAAARPDQLSLSRPSNNGLVLTWSLNGNPAGTRYRARLTAPDGSVIQQETLNPTTAFTLLDPSLSYGLTLEAMNEDDWTTPVSSLTAMSVDNGTHWRYAFDEGMTVDARVGGQTPVTLTVVPVTSFPEAASRPDGLTPRGRGFRLLTPQSLPAGAYFTITLTFASGHRDAIDDTDVLARYDADQGVWSALPPISGPLSGASTQSGIFQVMGRGGAAADPRNDRAFPNPFRPEVHGFLSLPGGGDVIIRNVSGRRVRSLSSEAGVARWDGKDDAGEIVSSGVYVGASGQRTWKIIVER